MDKSITAALYANRQMHTYNTVMDIVGKYFNVIDLSCKPKEYDPSKDKESILKSDIVISIFNPTRITGEALNKPNFNIHAAPTWYRGIGAIGRAIADRRTEHGVVVHSMVYEYDAGSILSEDIFSIEGLSAKDIGAECVTRALERLNWACEYFVTYGFLPNDYPSAKWSGDIMSLGEFHNWLESADFEGRNEVIKIYKPF